MSEDLVLTVPTDIERVPAQYHDEQARLLADRIGGLGDLVVQLQDQVAVLTTEVAEFKSDVSTYYQPALRNSMEMENKATSIQAAWTDIDNFDTHPFSTSFGIAMTLATGEITMDYVGDYVCFLSGSMSHDSSNGDRTFNVRTYDNTAGTADPTLFPVFIGRNQVGSNVNLVIPYNTNLSEVGHNIVFQMASSDAFSNVVVDYMSLTVHTVSNWLGGAI